jgi:hypothetical protein
MNTKNYIKLSLGFVALVVVYLVCFMASTRLLPYDPDAQFTPEQTSAAGFAILVVSVSNSLAISILIRRSRWHGWKLAGAVALVFYGVYTLLSQIETLAYPAAAAQMPAGMVNALFLSGLALTVPVSLLAVALMGKARKTVEADMPNQRLVMPPKEWVWKLAMLAVLYPIIYYVIGYYNTWRNPAAPAFYGGTDPGNFLLQMWNVISTTPAVFFLQPLRALLWTVISLPVIRMLKGGMLETALTLGFLFASLMGFQLLFPNPYMPEIVRRLHMVEVSLQNLCFGIAIGVIMLWPKKSGWAVQASQIDAGKVSKTEGLDL